MEYMCMVTGKCYHFEISIYQLSKDGCASEQHDLLWERHNSYLFLLAMQ